MKITGQVWLALTVNERMGILQFASEQNQKRWQKRKAAAATEAH